MKLGNHGTWCGLFLDVLVLAVCRNRQTTDIYV